MNTLLVVEDDAITSEMLRRYFEIVGYDVLSATTGVEAIKLAQENHPAVIILDIILPDMDGYEICRRLRSEEGTDQIPVIFLTQKDDRRDRLDGLSLGADDYITKPFDMDELRLRVHNIIDRMGGASLVDARTGLPSNRQIRERLPRLMENKKTAYMDITIEHFAPFSQQYGPVASNQVIRTTAKLIADLLHEIDPMNSFIGHPEDHRFLIALPADNLKQVLEQLPDRFKKRLENFYDYVDFSRGKMKAGEELIPLMSLTLAEISSEDLKARLEDSSQ